MIVLAAHQAVEAVMKAIDMKPLKAVPERWGAWNRHREAVRELSRYTDRELGDIGIRRCDIEYVVRRPAQRRRAG
jgi:uncharacterized protein YjiS (DUF1127 family)